MLRQRMGEGQALPCVATVATDEVERLCCKNGLMFHELLRCGFQAFYAMNVCVCFDL